MIQGPPGTGKSQTITNLIAGAIGRGETVLFVAEKMAALEVVKRRLDAAGLGDACLELHSRKASKKAILAELKRTVELGQPRVGKVDDNLKLLRGRRDALNAYCEAANAEIEPAGVTPARRRSASGSNWAARPTSRALPMPDVPAMATWTGFEFRRRLAMVEGLEDRLKATGVPAGSSVSGAVAGRSCWRRNKDRLREAIAPGKRRP